MLLVIGVTGHTGRYFLEQLNVKEYNDKVRFLIRDNKTNLFENCNFEYETIIGDLNNQDDLINATKGVDTILEIYNIRYSLKVLNAAIKNKVNRIIFVHTTGIYSKYKMASHEYKIIEEEVIKKAKENNINITILRPTMIYGDICDHNISKFIKMIDKIRIYPLIAGGKAKIQPVHAKDLGIAYYSVLLNEKNTKNKSYNLSGATEISIKDMLKLISEKLNKKTIFIPIPMWISITAAYILKFISFGKINIIEKVLRMNETRVFDYKNAVDDFDYSPILFEEGLEKEIKQYIDVRR